MHDVAVSVVIVLIILVSVCMTGLAIHIAFVGRTQNGAHEANATDQDKEHEAWVVGLKDDADLFFTGSEVTNP